MSPWRASTAAPVRCSYPARGEPDARAHGGVLEARASPDAAAGHRARRPEECLARFEANLQAAGDANVARAD
eukprot:9033120-Alexandrium_andersonii.AAC.1